MEKEIVGGNEGYNNQSWPGHAFGISPAEAGLGKDCFTFLLRVFGTECFSCLFYKDLVLSRITRMGGMTTLWTLFPPIFPLSFSTINLAPREISCRIVVKGGAE